MTRNSRGGEKCIFPINQIKPIINLNTIKDKNKLVVPVQEVLLWFKK